MRRILSILLASSALFSCSTEEVINAPELQPISFGNMFIENSTRAIIYNRNEDLKQFYVYGNVKGNQNNTVNLYGDGALVYRNAELGESWDGVWKCDVTQYWIPDCTYQFAAISDVDNNNVKVTAPNGLPASITYNVASQADLLYASVPDVKTNVTGTPSGTGIENKTVAFTFNHLLSKVHFTFTNGFTEANGVELTVTDIKITNATASGTYKLSECEWTTLSGETSLNFGSTKTMKPGDADGVSSTECVLIPGKKNLNITLQVQHNKGEKKPVPVDITLTADLSKGCSYNFTAELNAQNITGIAPITFTINKSKWDDNELPVGPTYPAE